jgi:hypothetical protein
VRALRKGNLLTEGVRFCSCVIEIKYRVLECEGVAGGDIPMRSGVSGDYKPSKIIFQARFSRCLKNKPDGYNVSEHSYAQANRGF